MTEFSGPAMSRTANNNCSASIMGAAFQQVPKYVPGLNRVSATATRVNVA